MKINRAIGLVFFLFLAKIAIGEVFESVSGAIIAAMDTVETASHTASLELRKIH